MDAQSAVKKATAGKVGRASRTLAQLWQVPTFFLGLLAFLLVAATAPLRQDSAIREFDDDLEQLRQALSNKKEKIEASVALADGLLQHVGSYPRKAGTVHFLAGAVFCRLLEENPTGATDDLRERAISYLEKAQALGVSEEDTLPLLYRLGQMLFESGRDAERALAYLAQAVDRGTDQPAKGYGMLVQGYLRLPRPNLDAALDANLKQLEYTEDEEDLFRGRLLRGELLVKKGKRLDALGELENIGARAPRELRLRARKLQTQCCQEEGLWGRAIPLWQELLNDPAAVSGGKSRILYSLGLCYQHADPPDVTQAAAAWKQVADLGGEEAQAAGLGLGELYLTSWPPDPGQGLAELTRALVKISAAQDFQNRLVELSRVRIIFENAWRVFQVQRDYRRAEQLAELYKKVADRGVAEERLGQTFEAWAKELQEKAATGTGEQATTWQQEARSQFIKSAAAYELAANARAADDQSDVLAKSADGFLAAKEFSRAIIVLERFVILNNTDEALADKWLALADALRAVGQKDQARQALHKCIEIPNTFFAYRARYQLAKDAIEEGKLDHAESILRQNLPAQGPARDREAHAQSLYLLADLLFKRPNYDQASLFLKEATRQYPENPKAQSARDQLGVCYRKLAEEVYRKLQDKMSAEAKTYLTRSRREWLELAARTYQELADDLEKRALPPDPVLLSKAYFTVAELRFELDEFTEAMRRFRILLENNRGRWEGVLACHGIGRCMAALYNIPEQKSIGLEAARDAVQKTLADVEKMGANHEAFQGPTRKSQAEWLFWLRKLDAWVNAQLPPPAPPVPPSAFKQ